jgi:hypothetical protein
VERLIQAAHNISRYNLQSRLCPPLVLASAHVVHRFSEMAFSTPRPRPQKQARPTCVIYTPCREPRPIEYSKPMVAHLEFVWVNRLGRRRTRPGVRGGNSVTQVPLVRNIPAKVTPNLATLWGKGGPEPTLTTGNWPRVLGVEPIRRYLFPGLVVAWLSGHASFLSSLQPALLPLAIASTVRL